MEVENKLKAMGLELPPTRGTTAQRGPARSKLATYCSWAGTRRDRRTGESWEPVCGWSGVANGARQACLNCLADVKAVIGDLDKVKRVAGCLVVHGKLRP